MSLRGQVLARVRELVDEEELDEHLPPEEGDGALPWTLICAVWWWLALVFGGISVALFEFDDEGLVATPTVVAFAGLVAFGAVCGVLQYVARTPYQRRRRRLGRQGLIVPSAIVQVHNNWFRPDNEEPWGGMVVASFDPTAEDDGGERLQAIVSELWELKRADRRELDDDELRFAWTMYAEMGTKRRLRLPPVLCHGLQDCWLLPTILPVAPLRQGEILIYTLMLPDEDAADAAAVLPVELAVPEV